MARAEDNGVIPAPARRLARWALSVGVILWLGPARLGAVPPAAVAPSVTPPASAAAPVVVGAQGAGTSGPVSAIPGGSATVDVDVAAVAGTVSPTLLGHNIHWDTADRAADLSAAGKGRLHGKVAELLGPLQIPAVRFPGGLLGNCYDWTLGVTSYDANGVAQPRKNNVLYDFATRQCRQGPVNRFGTDEFMAALAQLNPARPAEAVMIVNLCQKQPTATAGSNACAGIAPSGGGPPTGTAICPDPAGGNCPGAVDAANWVSYLNGTDSADPWVQLRARNGHPSPYNVRYFELGNELNLLNTPPDVYRKLIAAYVPRMRAASPVPIAIGAVASDTWDTAVAGDGHVDFLAPHLYAPHSDEVTAVLQAGPTPRSQSWPVTVPSTGGPFQVQASVYRDCSSLAALLDGRPLALSAKSGGAYGRPARCAWDAGTPSGGSRVVTFQAAPGQTVRISAAALCGTGSTVSNCAKPTPVNLSPYDPNPAAIAILRPPGNPWISSLSRDLAAPVTGRFTVEVRAYGSPVRFTARDGSTQESCPTLDVVAGAEVQQVPLADPARRDGEACFSVSRPKVAQLSFSASQPVRAVTLRYRVGAGGGAVNVVSAAVNGQRLDLSPYANRPGMADAVVYAAAQAQGGVLDQIRGRIAASSRPQVQILPTEWSESSSQFSPASDHQPDNLRSALYDALFLQQMIRRNVAGSNFFTLNGGYWHAFHCLASSQSDPPEACGRSDVTPYLSIPGQVFAVLAGRVGTSWVGTTVSAPSVEVPANVSADFRVLQPAQTVRIVEALATTAPGWVHLQLVNLSPVAPGVDVQVNLANAALGGASGSLTTLSGATDDINGCKPSPSQPTPTCTPRRVVPTTSTVSTGTRMDVRLPPNSFSVLSIPLAGGPAGTQAAAPASRAADDRPAASEPGPTPTSASTAAPEPAPSGPGGVQPRAGSSRSRQRLVVPLVNTVGQTLTPVLGQLAPT